MENKKEFALWLYKEGSLKYIRNIFDVVIALFKNIFGVGNHINLGIGTKLLALALHLYDDKDITEENGTIVHKLYCIDGKKYKWLQLSNKEKIHNGDSLITKATKEPGLHILGQFTMYETNSEYRISDVYDFNDFGTLYAKDIKNPTIYDRLRYFVGTYGRNKSLKVDSVISKDTALKWYNKFLLKKGLLLV